VHLTTVEQGHRLKQRLILKIIGLRMRSGAPDVVKTLLYRPGLFGAPFNALCQGVLRGPSEWSVGERELFAAFTARLNACRF
jgi:hypothetical protein